MRTLESLRNSCVDGANSTIYDTTLPLTAGIQDSANQLIPEIVLQPGRYIIETRIDLKFDTVSGYYKNGIDTHKVLANYRIYDTDPDVVNTSYIVLNDGGSLYSYGQASRESIILQSNITTQFDVTQDTSGEGSYALNKGLFYNIYCSKPYLNTSTINIRIIRLF